MKHVHRIAVMLIPKQPLVDWVNGHDPENEISRADAASDPTTYLLEVVMSQGDFPRIIAGAYEGLFANELSGWHADSSRWPPDRTLEMFFEWFDIVGGSQVIDMEPSDPFYDDDGTDDLDDEEDVDDVDDERSRSR